MPKIEVLIVEDDESIRQLVSELLEAEGYQVHAASNGREALDFLESAPVPPRLVLLDLMMPIMNGWEFLNVRETHQKALAVPVIVLSAVADSVKGANVAGFIKKPLPIDRLLSLVRSHCSAN